MYKNELEKYTTAKNILNDYPGKEPNRYSIGAPKKNFF